MGLAEIGGNGGQKLHQAGQQQTGAIEGVSGTTATNLQEETRYIP